MELEKVKVHTSRTQVDSKVFINLHARIIVLDLHCHQSGVRTIYMEPHASSEILTRSDLTIWLNPKPKVLAHKLFRDVQAPSRGSGGMLSQKILKISVLKFAENAFLTF